MSTSNKYRYGLDQIECITLSQQSNININVYSKTGGLDIQYVPFANLFSPSSSLYSMIGKMMWLLLILHHPSSHSVATPTNELVVPLLNLMHKVTCRRERSRRDITLDSGGGVHRIATNGLHSGIQESHQHCLRCGSPSARFVLDRLPQFRLAPLL